MVASADGDSELVTADQVTDRLADDPVLRVAAALCVLPMVWVEGSGVRFRRADLEAWVEQQRAQQRRRALTDAARSQAEPGHESKNT
jgi:hypothetical protein